MTSPEEIIFIADNMLGKLTKWLRLIGYSCTFADKKDYSEIVIYSQKNCVFLTRRKLQLCEFYECLRLVEPNQMRCFVDIVRRYDLDIHSFQFSRCINCNACVRSVRKEKVADKIPETSYRVYEIFFQCPVCLNVYWKGSHGKNVEHILKYLFA